MGKCLLTVNWVEFLHQNCGHPNVDDASKRLSDDKKIPLIDNQGATS